MNTKRSLFKNLFIPAMAILLVATAVASFGFKNVKRAKPNQSTQLIVGVGYRSEKCGSASFSKAVCYKGHTTSADQNYSEVLTYIKSYLVETCNVEESDISTSSSTKAMAVIIKYEKVMTGWNCSVTKYAVGFGDTQKEASDNAVAKKNTDEPGATWLPVTTLYK